MQDRVGLQKGSPLIAVRATLAAILSLFCAGPVLADCAEVEGPCEVSLGEYHIALPDGDGPFPAIIMLHGAGGRGSGMVNMLARAANARGYAVIGPQGMQRPGSRFGSSWSFHPERSDFRDEAAFLENVLSHAANGHDIDRDRILMSGFSIGGSMASYIGCETPGLARAFAPVAGSFWRPHPGLQDCVEPVHVLHTHGWSDGTVPIEGRVFQGGAIRQGDVFAALEVWRETNGCGLSAPDEITNDGFYWHRIWTSCDAGSLQFSLFPGGHAVPRGWVGLALDWFESLPDDR